MITFILISIGVASLIGGIAALACHEKRSTIVALFCVFFVLTIFPSLCFKDGARAIQREAVSRDFGYIIVTNGQIAATSYKFEWKEKE